MAKLIMQRMTIAAPQSERKELLEFVQRRGLLECSATQEDAFFRQENTSGQIALFERTAASAESALEILNTHCPEKKGLLDGFKGRREVSLSEYSKLLARSRETFGVISDLNALQQQQLEGQAEVTRLNAQLAELEPWLPLDVVPVELETLHASAFVGAVPFQTDADAFAAQLSEKLKDAESAHADVAVAVELIFASKEMSALLVYTNRSDSETVSAVLRSFGFTRPSVLDKTLPREKQTLLLERRTALQKDGQTIESLYQTFADKRELLQFYIDYYRMRSEKYAVLGKVWQTKNCFVLSGYIPEKYAGKLAEALEQRFDAAVELEAVDPEDETVPIALENGAFSRPVQNIVEMYSMPGAHDIDPTSLTCIFFYFFFGMMFSDAGYGLLMMLGTAFMLLKMPLEEKTRDTMRMFFYCGVTTTFWGLMYGSFFGDAIQVISREFFGREIVFQPLWCNPVDEPMMLLIVSIGLGFVQIFVGLGADMYRLCKMGQVADAILDVGTWYLVLGGMIAWLGGAIGGLSVLASVGMWVFIVGLAVLILTGGRKSPKLFGKLFGGIPKLYSITSYVSDALSYSRLMALGLATGVIGQVFNLLGSMGGKSVFGVIVFILIFAVGHGINFGINALGAYAHTIRLQYVEFFGKFYEGGGKPFVPFSTKTKYVRIKED